MGDAAAYWEDVHAGKDVDGVSWWQDDDAVWVDLVERTGAGKDAHVVDIGSGSSTLPDALLRFACFHVAAEQGTLGRAHVRLRIRAPASVHNALCTPLHSADFRA